MSSIIENSKIKNNNIIGPFAYIRENTIIKNSCIIGAYVEITRSFIKNNNLISHRAFMGDAKFEIKNIIGAGTVFCNYNFKTNNKEKSSIGSNCKIGSNSTIVAPVKIKSFTIIPASTEFMLKKIILNKKIFYFIISVHLFRIFFLENILLYAFFADLFIFNFHDVSFANFTNKLAILISELGT